MNRSVRGVATSLGIGFAVYFAARGLAWIPDAPANPLLMIAAVALYLVVVITAIVWRADAGPRMPLWTALVALAATAVVPYLVTAALPVDMRTAPFATWYIGALGLLGVVCVVRRRFITAWLLLITLDTVASVHLGFLDALSLGLVGSMMWVCVARLLVLFWDRAVRDTERLADIQRAVSAWHATQQVRQQERRVRTQFALAVAGPVLGRVVAGRGVLTEEERLEARLAEGRLRDELRGADLLNDCVRDAIESVRRRGGTVTVFDEGGLEGIDEVRRAEIRDELAAVVRDTRASRLIIRSAHDAVNAVTIVGRDRQGASSDEDSVELWHAIPRVV